MNAAGRFEKVSLEEYIRAWENAGLINRDEGHGQDRRKRLESIWRDIRLPVRATGGSAGYDFFVPDSVCVSPGESVVIPTGVRAYIENGYFLMMVPRSGLGFKHGFRLENTVGIIDSDYYFADNEGQIMAKFSVTSPLSLHPGDRFMQGIFVPFGETSNDHPLQPARRGGFGSTGK